MSCTFLKRGSWGSSDPLVVGRDHHGVDPARFGGPPEHVLDHRPAVEIGERLAWQPGRCVAGGDDGDSAGRGGEQERIGEIRTGHGQ
jgi:hypothetical protein